MAFGVVSTGFNKKTFEDIRQELAEDLVSSLGVVRTDSQSKFGMLLDFFSSKFSDIWDVLEDVYNARAISSSGSALDDIVYWSGLTRIPAAKSTINEIIYGYEGTEVPVGTIIRGLSTGHQFVLNSLADMTVSQMAIADCTVVVQGFSGATTFTLTLDVEVSFTSDGFINNPIAVAGVFVIAINILSPKCIAINGDNGSFTIRAKNFSDRTIPLIIGTPTVLSVDKLGSAFPFIAQEYGKVAVPIGDLTSLITSIDGATCNNLEQPILGREIETDTELRTRFVVVRSALGYSTVNAIRNRILQEVDNIIDCFVYENVTNVVDSDGILPGYIMVVVDCSTESEQAVANKIFEVKAGGVPTHGSVSKTVEDSQGNIHTIKLSKVVYQYVWVSVIVTLSPETAFPVDGVSQIKEAILKHGESLGIGEDVVYQAMYRPVFSVKGVSSVVLQIGASTDPNDESPSVGTDTIVIAKSSKTKFDLSRITVTIA